jgi:hypothetical protein
MARWLLLPLLALLVVAPVARADGKPDAPPACPEGQVFDPNAGACVTKESSSQQQPKPPRQDGQPGDEQKQQAPSKIEGAELKKCPPGERLQQVVCIRAPCPPQCVKIPEKKQ